MTAVGRRWEDANRRESICLSSDDAGVHQGEDPIEFCDASKFSGFGFADGLGFVFFEEGFEPGLEVFGEFEEVETAYLLDLDAGVDPGGGLNHGLGDHCGDLDERDVGSF
jgi:hypothetical protein